MASQASAYTPLFARSQAGITTVAGIDQVPGTVWFVNSASGSDATGYGRRPDSPFATLAYAFSSDSVTSGDVVYVMPGHAETVNAAGDITMDIAGVTVVGLGRGSSRPTFTYATDTASTWLITAANVTVRNVLITCTGTIDVANAITITGADVSLVDVDVRDSAATSQFADPIIVSTGADRCRLERVRVFSHASGDAAQSAILLSAAVVDVEIIDHYSDGLFATGNIESTAAALNTVIKNAVTRQRHATRDAGINLHASNTGFVLAPRVWSATNDADGFNLAIVAAAASVFDPLVVNLAGERGGAWGTASAAA